MMALESSTTVIGDQNETFSTRNTSNLKTTFDHQLTKAEFVEILKQLGDFQLFIQFYDSQRLRLKTGGLQGQFLEKDVAEFQGLMKIKLNVHADWERWLAKLLEISQGCALVLPLWHPAYERLYECAEHTIRPPALVKAWLETRMTTENPLLGQAPGPPED